MQVQIPSRFVRCCTDWYEGSGSMMYAISSTGALSLGTVRPLGCDTDEKWMWHLLNELESEIYHCIRVIRKTRNLTGLRLLEDFSRFVRHELEKLPEPEDE